MTVKRAIHEAGLPAEKACELIAAYVERTETHNTAGLMRRAIYAGFCRAADLVVVDKGKASAVVVVSPKAGPWEKRAADDLVKFI